jgi:hypothetical protein
VRRLMRLMGLTALGPSRRHRSRRRGTRSTRTSCAADRASKPGVGGRHHLRSDRARLPLSGRDHGLGEPSSSGVAAVEHARRRFLRPGAGGGARPVRHTADLQHRSG